MFAQNHRVVLVATCLLGVGACTVSSDSLPEQSLAEVSFFQGQQTCVDLAEELLRELGIDREGSPIREALGVRSAELQAVKRSVWGYPELDAYRDDTLEVYSENHRVYEGVRNVWVSIPFMNARPVFHCRQTEAETELVWFSLGTDANDDYAEQKIERSSEDEGLSNDTKVFEFVDEKLSALVDHPLWGPAELIPERSTKSRDQFYHSSYWQGLKIVPASACREVPEVLREHIEACQGSGQTHFVAPRAMLVTSNRPLSEKVARFPTWPFEGMPIKGTYEQHRRSKELIKIGDWAADDAYIRRMEAVLHEGRGKFTTQSFVRTNDGYDLELVVSEVDGVSDLSVLRKSAAVGIPMREAAAYRFARDVLGFGNVSVAVFRKEWDQIRSPLSGGPISAVVKPYVPAVNDPISIRFNSELGAYFKDRGNDEFLARRVATQPDVWENFLFDYLLGVADRYPISPGHSILNNTLFSMDGRSIYIDNSYWGPESRVSRLHEFLMTSRVPARFMSVLKSLADGLAYPALATWLDRTTFSGYDEGFVGCSIMERAKLLLEGQRFVPTGSATYARVMNACWHTDL